MSIAIKKQKSLNVKQSFIEGYASLVSFITPERMHRNIIEYARRVPQSKVDEVFLNIKTKYQFKENNKLIYCPFCILYAEEGVHPCTYGRMKRACDKKTRVHEFFITQIETDKEAIKERILMYLGDYLKTLNLIN